MCSCAIHLTILSIGQMSEDPVSQRKPRAACNNRVSFCQNLLVLLLNKLSALFSLQKTIDHLKWMLPYMVKIWSKSPATHPCTFHFHKK